MLALSVDNYVIMLQNGLRPTHQQPAVSVGLVQTCRFNMLPPSHRPTGGGTARLAGGTAGGLVELAVTPFNASMLITISDIRLFIESLFSSVLLGLR